MLTTCTQFGGKFNDIVILMLTPLLFVSWVNANFNNRILWQLIHLHQYTICLTSIHVICTHVEVLRILECVF